jgi:outer membrane protein assembly factor BamB
MLVLRAGVAALFGAALAACGGADAVKPAGLVDFKPTAKARVVWRASAGEAKPFVFAPAFHNGSIYVASRGGQLTRLDAAKGKPIWRVDTKEKLSGGVGADGDLVLVGTPKGAVLAYSTEGKALWRAQVTSEVLGAPRAAQGIVVVRSGDGRFFGLDAATGARKWEYQVSLPSLQLRAQPSVNIVGKLVLAGLPAGRVIALDLASGTPVWEALVAQPKGDNELERITDVVGTPVMLDSERACAAAYQGRVACVDIDKGTLAWGRDASSAARVGIDRITLYVTEANGAIVAFDKESGATVWKQDKLLNRGVSGAIVSGEFVAVGDYQGYVHVLDAEDGAFAARVATDGSAIGAEPLRVGNNVVVQTGKGGVFAIAIK